MAQNNLNNFIIGTNEVEIPYSELVDRAKRDLIQTLADRNISGDNAKSILESFNTLINGLYDGTFTYNPVKTGFDTKLKDSFDNDDNLGYAAGILGNAIRNLSKTYASYADKNKRKYTGRNTLLDLVDFLLMGENPNIQGFINLDEYVNGLRGLSQRLPLMNEALLQLTDNKYWKKHLTGYSLELYDDFVSDYNKLFPKGSIDINENGVIDSQELLNLNKLLGSDNANKYFYTGETWQDGIPGIEPYYFSAEEYISAKHPKVLVDLYMSPISVADTRGDEYTGDELTYLLQKLSEYSAELLMKILPLAMEGKNLNRLSNLWDGNEANLTTFNNQTIVLMAILLLLKLGIAKLFPDNPNKIYIPVNHETLNKNLDKRGTGLVLDTSNFTINEVSRYEIPFYILLWTNEYNSKYSSYKEGGKIKKCEKGSYLTYLNTLYTDDDDEYNLSGIPKDREFYGFDGSNHTRGEEAQLNTYSDKFDEDKNAKTSFSTQDALNTMSSYISSDYYLLDSIEYIKRLRKENPNMSPEEIMNLANSQISALRNWLLNRWDDPEAPGFSMAYNKKGQAEKNHLFNLIYPHYSDYSEKDNIHDILGSATQGRLVPVHLTINVNSDRRKINTGDGFDYWIDNAGYYRTGNYRGATLNPEKNPALETLLEPKEDKPEDPSIGTKWIEEMLLKLLNLKLKSYKNLGENILPELLNIGSLWNTIRGNNKQESLLKRTPMILDPIDLHRNIYGDFATMQNLKAIGALTLSNLSQPLTSSIERAMQMMYAGLMAANEADAKGNLANNLAIKTDIEKAFNLIKELKYKNKSETYDPNKKMIHSTNDYNKQLKASILNKNTKAVSDYMNELALKLRYLFNLKKTEANQFYDSVAQSTANDYLKAYKDQADKELLAWWDSPDGKDANGNYKPMRQWPGYPDYLDKISEGIARKNELLNYYIADKLGIKYDGKYSLDGINTFFNLGWL